MMYTPLDPHIVEARKEEFNLAYQSMRNDWRDRRELVEEALKRWLDDHGESENGLLFERLRGWTDVILLQRYLLSAEAAAYSDLSERLIDDKDFWDTDVQGLFKSDLANNREVLYRLVFGDNEPEQV
jgi:hypothetical protein